MATQAQHDWVSDSVLNRLAGAAPAVGKSRPKVRHHATVAAEQRKTATVYAERERERRAVAWAARCRSGNPGLDRDTRKAYGAVSRLLVTGVGLDAVEARLAAQAEAGDVLAGVHAELLAALRFDFALGVDL